MCQIDKSPGFYIGDTATITLKAYEYMNTTKAYKEIGDNHFCYQKLSQKVIDYLFIAFLDFRIEITLTTVSKNTIFFNQ